MRKVLMISYRFAPQGGAGAIRSVKFVKYLPSLGWQPVVHTVANPHWNVWDDALANEIPQGVVVHRTRTFEPEGAGEQAGGHVLSAASRGLSGGTVSRMRRTLGRVRRWMRVWLFVPDKQSAWIPWAVLRTLWMVRRHRPDVLYTSSPPHSVQVVGLAIKWLTGLPWVVDFRDLWMQSIHRQAMYRRHRWRHRLETVLERAVVRRADRVITTTEPNRDELAEKYGVVGKVVAIPNGYDAADFDQPCQRPDDLDASCFNLTMTGQVEKLFDMEPFYRALATAMEQTPELRERLRVRLIGADPGPHEKHVRRLGLEANVRYMSYAPHEEVLHYVRGSDALFLCQIPDPISAGVKLSVKLFEYFAAERPILALTTAESITAELLADAGVGVQVAPDDTHGISSAILDLFGRWKDGRRTMEATPGFLERFERGQHTKRLAGLFDEVAPPRSESYARATSATAVTRPETP